MTTPEQDTTQKVLVIAQTLLRDEQDGSAVTPALIATKLDMIVAMNPKWAASLNREHATDELIRRFSLWIGQDTTLKSDSGHAPWLNAGRKKEWRYWQRYQDWLEQRMSVHAVESLGRSTDSVLSLLEDPHREGPWDRRGLVVGHVQSGKTSHYTGLICKAADAGYKIIIILAGLHNNLRSQTQKRLDEGFLGYETRTSAEGAMTPIGVGEIDGDPKIRPNYVTNRSDKGDFSTAVARNLGITPESLPWLFVVKKNKTVLERLLIWIRGHVANVEEAETKRKLVTHLPLLLIDDEADHASVDTGEQVFEADGQPDDEHQPTAINKLVRRILNTFTRSAYVGYTATPFANIFIHERGETREEGTDLFPSSFIHSLAAPSNYIGPASVFGLRSPDGRKGGLALIRKVSDFSNADGVGGWMPPKHGNGYLPRHGGKDELPPSLIEAVDAFLLACTVRQLRGQGSEHCSMLIHVTRFTSVQNEVHRQVEDHVRKIKQRLLRRIDHEQIIARMHALWDLTFVPGATQVRASRHADQIPDGMPAWEEIATTLPDAIADVDVRIINGTAKDALDYTDERALKVIAIGGDKLARGLTLEGLSTSYFLRASKMYDTLMQMGRWFGYRRGYLDLCRLYTTTELTGWFEHIADAAEELRQEFDLMYASGATPREYGLKVQSHSTLMVTSRLKMRAAKNLLISFSGQLMETILFYRDRVILADNVAATRDLLSDLGPPERHPERLRAGGKSTWHGFLWTSLPATKIVDFLLRYRTHPDNHKVNNLLLSQFVKSMSAAGELTEWTVVLLGSSEGERTTSLGPGIDIAMMKRSNESDDADRYAIGRLMSPRDEAIDLDEAQWLSALALTKAAWRDDPGRKPDRKEPEIPNGPAIRRIRGMGGSGVPPHRERGLIFLYALDPLRSEESEHPARSPEFDEETPPVIAMAISFGDSNLGVKVEYTVNNVLWEQEYGPAD